MAFGLLAYCLSGCVLANCGGVYVDFERNGAAEQWGHDGPSGSDGRCGVGRRGWARVVWADAADTSVVGPGGRWGGGGGVRVRARTGGRGGSVAEAGDQLAEAVFGGECGGHW